MNAESEIAYRVGLSNGRAQMALEHGIADDALMLTNALYASAVHLLFRWLAFWSPLGKIARRVAAAEEGQRNGE